MGHAVLRKVALPHSVSEETLESLPSNETVLSAPSGITAKVVGDAIAIFDASLRVVARCTPDAIEIVADARDLVLRAPSGRVRIDAALDVELSAGRDFKSTAGRDLDLTSGRRVHLAAAPSAASHVELETSQTKSGARITLDADRAQVESRRLDIDVKLVQGVFGAVSLLARHIATKADSVALQARSYEVSATSLTTKAKDVLTDVVDSVETRAGRMRSIVSGLFAVHTERTALTSKEDTSIDGKKILLG